MSDSSSGNNNINASGVVPQGTGQQPVRRRHNAGSAATTRNNKNQLPLPSVDSQGKDDKFNSLGWTLRNGGYCVDQSIRLLREHFDLYATLGAVIVIPVTILLTTLLAIPFRSEAAEFSVLEMTVFQVSLQLANGPLMLLTATWCVAETTTTTTTTTTTGTAGSSTTTEGLLLPPASQWTAVLSSFYSDPTLRRSAFCMAGASTVAFVGSLLASIFLYVPGIYLSVAWFAVPCIVLFEQPQQEQQHDDNDRHSNSKNNQDCIVRILRALRRSTSLTKGSRCNLFALVLQCFLAYTIPAFFLAAFSAMVHNLVREHILLGTAFMANLLGGAAYIVPSMLAKIVVVPFMIVLKTVVYLELLRSQEEEREGLTLLRETIVRQNPVLLTAWWNNNNNNNTSHNVATLSSAPGGSEDDDEEQQALLVGVDDCVS